MTISQQTDELPIKKYDQISHNGKDWHLVLDVRFGYVQATGGGRYTWNTQSDGRQKEFYVEYLDCSFVAKKAFDQLEKYLILKPVYIKENNGILQTVIYDDKPIKVWHLFEHFRNPEQLII